MTNDPIRVLSTRPLDGVPGHEGSEACSVDNPASRVIRELLARVGDKWSMLVIGVLHDGPLRFTELQRKIDGISHRMLTQTLRSLERDGLVTRTSYPEIPPRVEYAATALGRSLSEPVIELARWASAHHSEILDAREAFDDQHEASATLR
ncbi:winged helix-turn-helix transcriptional regulator [Agromyces cerinus]|uniref:Transcriptional regulator, HxlR family n=1 Tax=Agromyces cerinus subsp. cerinus TaxID=232089 RepID=A0A1N6IAW0_9MICO|nr:helix-turn-helix domain-containing protein [Agromyces cerinus]SIO29178.1 transcriptional regulator, HxlR family [Agromyces cerinus subsp. cerinus]